MDNKFLKMTTILSSILMFPGILLADSYYDNPAGDGDGVVATENNNGAVGQQTRIEADGSSLNKSTAIYLPDGVSTGVNSESSGTAFSGGKTGVRGGSVDVDITVYDDKITSDATVSKSENTNSMGDGDGVVTTDKYKGGLGQQTRIEADGSSFNKNTTTYLPDGASTGVDNPEPSDGDTYSGGKTGVRGGSVDVDVTVYNDKIMKNVTVTKPEGVSVIPGKRMRNRP